MRCKILLGQYDILHTDVNNTSNLFWTFVASLFGWRVFVYPRACGLVEGDDFENLLTSCLTLKELSLFIFTTKQTRTYLWWDSPLISIPSFGCSHQSW